MAIERYKITDRFGKEQYAALELNNVAFRRDGRVEAQSPLVKEVEIAENGMILAIDKANGYVRKPADGDSALAVPPLYGLNYSAEHNYDSTHDSLGEFHLKADGQDFYPRLGYLAVGDLFTTNCLAYDTATYSTPDAFIEAVTDGTLVFGGIHESGAIVCTAEDAKPAFGPVLHIIKATTMPNGTFGIKFQVASC